MLKELYQELVDPDVRKLLGEFYTPNWLAQSMVNEILEKEPEKSIWIHHADLAHFYSKLYNTK